MRPSHAFTICDGATGHGVLCEARDVAKNCELAEPLRATQRRPRQQPRPGRSAIGLLDASTARAASVFDAHYRTTTDMDSGRYGKHA